MITYEDFLKQTEKKQIKFLDFSVGSVYTPKNPSEYIDIARKSPSLKELLISDAGSKEYYQGLVEFVQNCQNDLSISSDFIGSCDTKDFITGEKIIEDVISQINPDWSVKQKLAFLHYKMGELISYVPDFDNRVLNLGSRVGNNARNAWTSLIDGKSICTGVTYIERTILSRLGIETEVLRGKTHAYMLTKTDEGNIITDATWDLSKSLYKAIPDHFGVTYEELIRRENGLSNSHKLDIPPENVIEITEKELRELYRSIGIVGDDLKFPLPLFQKIEELNSKKFASKEEKLNAFFSMFTQYFSKEATHLQETRSILEFALLDLGFSSESIKSKYVYSSDDINYETPQLVFHISSDNLQNSVRILNLEEMQFDKISLKDFDIKYQVHYMDKQEPFWKSLLEKQSVENEKLEPPKQNQHSEIE